MRADKDYTPSELFLRFTAFLLVPAFIGYFAGQIYCGFTGRPVSCHRTLPFYMSAFVVLFAGAFYYLLEYLHTFNHCLKANRYRHGRGAAHCFVETIRTFRHNQEEKWKKITGKKDKSDYDSVRVT